MTTSPVVQFMELLETDWSAAVKADEWCFVRLCESVETLAPLEASGEIPVVAELLLQQREPFLRRECGWMLSALVRRTETTLMPIGLEQHWDAVIGAVDGDPLLSAELRQWYRR